MRKEVRFKAVSAFIFFAGVLFEFNDAFVLSPKKQFQDGFFPMFEDYEYQFTPIFGMPPFGGYNGIIPTPLVSGGHSSETNVAYTFGDVNGLPYYSKVTTYDAEDSVPYYGRYPDFALYQAEIAQSPYLARNPTVIYYTGNPYAPWLPGKYFEFSGFGVPNFRAADESEPFEESGQPVPRLLLNYMLPYVPKSRRYHYSRRSRAEGYGPQNDQHSSPASMHQAWYDNHRPSKDKSKGHHDREIKPSIYKTTSRPPTEAEAEPIYVSPTITAPDDKPSYTPSQPLSDDGSSSSPYAKQLSSEHTRPQYSYPDGPDDMHIHFPTQYSDEELPPIIPHSPPSRLYSEDQPRLSYSDYFPSSHHVDDEPHPSYEYFPSSHHIDDEPHPSYEYFPSSHHIDDEPHPSYEYFPSSRRVDDEPHPSYEYFPSSRHVDDHPPPAHPPYPPSSVHYVEDQPPAHLPHPPSPRYVEDQSPLSFRQFPPWPYFSGQTESGPFPQYPSLSFYSDEIGFPFFTPLPFIQEDPGFPFFPPFPFFPDIQEPSPFPQPQTPPYFAGSFASTQYPTTIVYTTTSRPSSHNGKTKSRITVQSTSPATEILTDDSQHPCGANKNSKSKTSTHCWETADNQVILLTHEEDDSPSEDDEESEPSMTVFSILKKIAKILFLQLITPSDPDDE